MRTRFPILLAIIVAVTAMVIPATALGRPKHVPRGSVLAVNITYKVVNDEDSGFVGYWALTRYNKHVQVWKTPDGSFYVVARYVGRWATFAGALSPQEGIAQSKDGRGTFKGGYIATFTASDYQKARGFKGKYNFLGTKADILLGTYGAPQAGATPSFDWTQYFTDFAGFHYVKWGWVYKHRTQRWQNLSTGSKGDIQL